MCAGSANAGPIRLKRNKIEGSIDKQPDEAKMHPSKTLNWKSVLTQVRLSGYKGPSPEAPFWFGGSADLNAQLNALVASGKKTATASLLWEWEFDQDPLPTPGQCDALLGWANEFLGIISATRISVVPFREVSQEFAALEGEGDLSLDFWRDVHWSCFKRDCGRFGKEASEDMPVVCQEFKLEYLHDNT